MRVLLRREGLEPAVARRLRQAAMAVDVALSPAEARARLDEVDYDAIVVSAVDVEAGRWVVGQPLDARVALVVEVVRSAAEARVAAFRAGADEVVGPGLEPAELALRVAKAVVRRAGGVRGPVRLGRVVADVVTRQVALDGELLALTPHQRCAFLYLILHRYRLVPSTELLEHCWDEGTDSFTDPVSSQITRLRSALAGAVDLRWSSQGGYRLLVDDLPA